MAGIGELAVFVTANTKKAVTNLRNFGTRVKTTAATVAKASRTFAKVGLATAASTSAAAMAALAATTKQAFTEVDNLAKTSDMLGIMPEKLAGLRLAGEEAGLSISQLDTNMMKMVKRVSEASVGKGEGKGALAELGIDPVALNKLAPEEQLREIMKALEGVALQSDKVRLATELFGRQGANMTNMLKNGVGALDEAQVAAEMLGLSVDRFDASKVEEANDALGRVKSLMVGVGRVLAVEIAPYITMVSKGIVNWIKGMGGVQNVVNGVGGSFQKVAGFIMDMGEIIKLAFQAVQFGIFKVLAEVAKFVDKIAAGLQRLAAATGVGKDIANSIRNGTASVAGALDNTANELGENLQEAWLAPPPSSKLKAWTDQVAAAAEKSREEYNSGLADKEAAKENMLAAETVNTFLGNISGVGKLMAKGFSKSVEIKPAALQSAMSGTSEEYRLRAQMQNQRVGAQQQQTDATNNNTSAINELTESVKNSAEAFASRAETVTGFLGV